MYCQFFGFAEKPFDVTPDPKFLYFTPGHRETLASLVYGIRERRGFMTIVGEVGTGKTTLLHAVLDQLDQKVRVAFIFNTSITFDEMLTMALLDLKLVGPEETVSKVEALSRLKAFTVQELSRAGNVVLIMDEAQNLEPSAMENLRLLSNLETRKHKLIQIVLSGQPELDVKLTQPELRQISQRISLRRYISPLTKKETYEYIQHRLNVANYSGPALFDRSAQQLIWEYCDGVPRKINVLCDNALLIGYALRQKTIDTTVIYEVIKDLTWSPFVSPKESQGWGSIQLPPPLPKTIEASVIGGAIKDLSWSPLSSPRENQATDPMQPSPRSQRRVFASRFAMVTSLVLAACIISFVGFLFGTSRSTMQGSGILSYSPIQAMMATKISRPDQPPTLRQPASHDKSTTAREVAGSTTLHEGRGPADGMVADSSPSETRESPIRRPQLVIVKRGDTLSGIILETYGTYDRGVLSAVLKENPEILNPDRIMAGEVITLPEQH